MNDPATGFPSWETVNAYWVAHVPGVLPLGLPEGASVRVDPAASELTLRVVGDGPIPDLRLEAALAAYEVIEDGMRWLDVTAAVADNLVEVTAFLESLVDRLRQPETNLAAAVEASLGSFAALLLRKNRLSEEQEVGLFGELLVLSALYRAQSEAEHVSSWLGQENAEHDFRLAHTDLEVKTTRSEGRRHWITSLDQLQPSPDRQLHLVSIQVTRATPSLGLALGDLVSQTVELAGSQGPAILRLLSPRYKVEDSLKYPKCWSLRSDPAWYEIGEEFPAVTSARLLGAVPSSFAVTDLRYRLDLTSWPQAQPLVDSKHFRDNYSKGTA